MLLTSAHESIMLPQKSIGLQDIYFQSLAIYSECKDFTVKETPYYIDGSLKFNSIESDGVEQYQLSRYSLGQLCTKIGVPHRYLSKCYEAGEVDLVHRNINTWLENYRKPLFVRTYDKYVRGILSDKFTTFDSPDIIDSIIESKAFDSLDIKGFFISPERLHIRAVYPDMMKIAGEDLFSGIQIDSSDVGRSTCTVKFFVFKQVCTNGLCVNKLGGTLFTRKHIGMSIKEFQSEFMQSLDRVPELVAVTRSKIEEARKATLFMDTTDIDSLVSTIQAGTSLSTDNSKEVIQLMDSKYSFTKWGYVNSLTEIAQKFTLDKRLEIESIAGDILVA